MRRRGNDERSLVVAAQRGDRRALEELARTYLPLVYNVVGRALGSQPDVEDVVQETMLRMVRDLPDVRQPGSIRSWILAIAVHQVGTHRQRSAVGPLATDVVGDIREDGDFEDLAILRLQLSGERRQVAQAARWLDDDDRTVLALWWQEAAGYLSRAELADALNVSASYAAVRVQRMRGQLDRSRAIVAALEAHSLCPELSVTIEGWDGKPGSLWRKRIDRHVRECSECLSLSREDIRVERLLVGCTLVPVPAALSMAVAGGGGAQSAGLARRLTHLLRSHAVAATATATAAVIAVGGVAYAANRPSGPPSRTESVPVATAVPAIAAPSPTRSPKPEKPTPTKVPRTPVPKKQASIAKAGCGAGLSRIWASWPMPGKDHPASYTKLGNGTVRDNVTCLVWQQSAAPATYTFTKAKSYCANLKLAGQDWHLPTRVELTSIVDASRDAPAIDTTAFPGSPSQFFWTSSPWAVTKAPLRAWIINFYEGLASNGAYQSGAYWVRCVSGDDGTGRPAYRTGPSEVADPATGLVWQRRGTTSTMSASKAAAHCSAEGLRLPTLRELSTTVDETRVAPAIDVEAFPGTVGNGWYWTSDVAAPEPSRHWALNYDDGYTNYRNVTAAYVRCVR